jgi:hypothetical protein
MTGENSDYLQTSHYPPLNWSDQKNIDNLLKVSSTRMYRQAPTPTPRKHTKAFDLKIYCFYFKSQIIW